MGGHRGRLISESDRVIATKLIKEACASGARIAKACKILSISLRTYQRWRKENGFQDKRHLSKKVPANKLTPDERKKIIKVANSKEYCNLPPTQIVPRLADKEIYLASESTWYRIFREEKLLQHRSNVRPKKHKKPKELIATRPNELWSWDITYLPTQVVGLFNYLYMVMDIFSRKIVGWAVHKNESAEHASILIKQICLVEHIEFKQITLHSDNGGPMKGSTMLATLQKLGVIPSFSRPSVSDDNPYSESLFKTLKYHHSYPETKFATKEAAAAWVTNFVKWYNTTHLHSNIKFVTPEQRHNKEDIKILKKREATYFKARSQHPQRWSGDIRNWGYISEVVLNPGKGIKNGYVHDS